MTVRRHWLQAKTNANEGCNSCASLAGLVLLQVLFYLWSLLKAVICHIYSYALQFSPTSASSVCSFTKDFFSRKSSFTIEQKDLLLFAIQSLEQNLSLRWYDIAVGITFCPILLCTYKQYQNFLYRKAVKEVIINVFGNCCQLHIRILERSSSSKTATSHRTC